jgi:D-alanyl-D-alanine carboxypeptidase (penicillin-binding protein 5/6)
VLTSYGRRRLSATPEPLYVGFGVVAAIALFLVVLQSLRGLPDPDVKLTFPETTTLGEARLPALPQDGQAIVSVTGLGTLGQSGPVQARPIASVTKIMTAYVLLRDHPLNVGDSGPTVTVTAADADRFWEMVAQDQSVQPVNAGVVLTELQLLQGMLIPSANNYAEIAAKWDSGSVAAFVEKMNRTAQELGMANTRFVDVSGYLSGSVSTAADLLLLAREAMANPVFAQTVNTKSIRLPTAGTVSNVNELLGIDGIIGIKTGFTEDAGGNLAFAAKREAAGSIIEIVGVVLGQKDRPAAFTATRTILNSLTSGLQVVRAIPAGQPVGQAEPSWGNEVDIIVPEDVTMLIWPGMTMETTVEITGVPTDGKEGDQVGWLNVKVGEQEARVPLVLARDIDGAGIAWKLTRF